jgi:hypothetical protein
MYYDSPMTVLIIDIKGVPYKVLLQDKEKYQKSHGGNSYAHVNKHTKEIVFRKDHIEKRIVIHEVVHAFLNQCHLASCNDLSVEDFEEIVCELMEDHLLDITKVSNTIFKELRAAATLRSKRRKK